MAADWTKIEHDLPEKPEVIAMATRLKISPDEVVGKLIRVWRWFDRQTYDGNARGVTPPFIDSLLAFEGFAAAMTAVGWLNPRNGSISVPKFDRHISKSAKSRALGRERVKRSRNAQNVTEPLPETESEIEKRPKVNPRSDQKASRITRAQPSAADSADLRFSEEEILNDAGQMAAELFRKIDYDGNDGRLIWQAAILVTLARKIPEAWVRDAATGTHECGTTNPVGYFRKVLEERCSQRGIDLKHLLERVKIPAGKFTGPPNGRAVPRVALKKPD